MEILKYLSLYDLYNYFLSTNISSHFSSNNDRNKNIIVQINGKLVFDKNNHSNTENLLPVTLRACHAGTNINHSDISETALQNAIPSISNRPILGFIHDVDGVPQFYTHNMHLDKDGDIVYDEIPIGIIPESCNARLEEYDNKQYFVVDGFIFEGYTKAAEILKREKECSVSVEIEVRELSYNAHTKIMNIEDFFFNGVTILGVDEDGNKVKPGMTGSNITLADFSDHTNSMFSNNDKIIELLSDMNNKLDMFNENNQRKEEPKTVFEKLLEKYNKTKEDITFEYEGLSDEELKDLFAEHFETKKKKKNVDDDSSAVSGEPSGSGDDNQNQNSNTDQDQNQNTNTDQNQNTNTDQNQNTGDNQNTNTNGNQNAEPDQNQNTTPEPDNNADPGNFSKTFELSHDDIKRGIYELLIPYEDADNDWYYIIDVFDDHFIYKGENSNNFYDQKYIKDGDVVKFDGERIRVNVEYLTDSELVALNEMRSNYAEIKQKVESYEAEPSKMDILNKECYDQIRNDKSFVELSKQESHFDMSIEDVQKKADSMLLEYAKTHKIDFSYTVGMKRLPEKNKSVTKSRYGGIFAKSE